MKRSTSFLFFLFVLIQPFFVVAGRANSLQVSPDTVIAKPNIDTTKENKVINEVVESKSNIKKDKAEYLGKVTKYGFKDLFKNYSYNSAIPYSSQVNPNAETYMQDYLQAHQGYLLQLRKTGATYFNLIDRILIQYGLPRELKYLAVIESDLKTTALSPKGARGPWQFMPYTARDYGLIVNQNEDDRIDYSKSTNAAAKYLLSLYKDFKDWLLVIAAYNGGEGRVYNAIKKSGSHNFWDLQYDLPEESRNHVKKFIATHYVMETGSTDKNVSNSNFNYSDLSALDSSSFTAKLTDEEKNGSVSTEVSGRYNAEVIAKKVAMTQPDFDHYNPGFNNVLSTGASYKLQLPAEKMEQFKAKKFEILNESVEQLLQNVKSDFKKEKKEKH
ncbi:MAG: lytic transglycosylase domain-containing protein [Ginsengibacter sp.]